MNFLLDTNIIIPLEPTSPNEIEPGSKPATKMLRLLNQFQHGIFIHPLIRQDIQSDKNEERRKLRLELLAKYPTLESPPLPDENFLKILGKPDPLSHDHVDHMLLAALYGNSVNFLVTNDRGIKKKAKKLGSEFENGVLTVWEALSTLNGLHQLYVTKYPGISKGNTYELNIYDPIFSKLKQDYTGFEEWFSSIQKKHRECMFIRRDWDAAKSSTLAAVAIFKHEIKDQIPELSGKILKISTFIVSEDFAGYKYGELLLKEILHYAETNNYDCMFMTVFPKHEQLRLFIEDFGFIKSTMELHTSGNIEYIYYKILNPEIDHINPQDPLEFSIRYGPNREKIFNNNIFIIPIKPEFHKMLFPDYEMQTEIFPAFFPHQNTIKKIYLSHSSTKLIKNGDLVVFYRSIDESAITTIGVVEDTMRSSDLNKLIRFAGKRTVYSNEAIKGYTKKETLAILFRESRHLEKSIPLSELIENNIIKAAPQSIQKLEKDHELWIRSRLKILY